MQEPLISIHNLAFHYERNAKNIFETLCLTVYQGAYISVVGENGSGKSTLIKLILGLLKPSSGSLQCRTKTIGYVPQKKNVVTSFPITVYEALHSYQMILQSRDTPVIDRLLHDMNLTEHKNSIIGTLSGGQLQKIYIIRALIGNPDLLILDEPSTGIDIQSQQDIYAFIKHLNTENRLTVMSVEHNIDAAVLNSTEIFHLVNGCGHLCNPQQYAQEFLPVRS
ncbi:MAG: metal ABC transporter ATP-binding protein [Treponema sp.]